MPPYWLIINYCNKPENIYNLTWEMLGRPNVWPEKTKEYYTQNTSMDLEDGRRGLPFGGVCLVYQLSIVSFSFSHFLLLIPISHLPC